MVEEVEGIIINERPCGETSKILNILTDKYGLIGVMAKGCRTMKSSLRSVTGKLTYGKFILYYKKDKLSLLSEVTVLNNFNNIKKDIIKISYASFLIELSEQVYRQNPNYTIYQLLINGLIKINDNFDPLIITNIIELKYLDFLGVLPVLDGCAGCGSQINIVTLSSKVGGYLCSRCRVNEPIMDIKTIKLIRMYYYVDISKIEKLTVNDVSKKEINQFLDNYYDCYTGLYLKSKLFVNDISKF